MSSKISMKESARLMIRGYKIINGFASHNLLAMAAKSVFSAIYPFINIYLSALILNELVGPRDVARLTTLVLITIGANLVCLLIKNAMRRWVQSKQSLNYMQCQYLLEHKMQELDYADTQDADIQARFKQAYMNQVGIGFGMTRLLSKGIDDLVAAVTQIIASVALTVGMFYTFADKDGFLWLNNWWMNVLVVCTILAPIVVAALSSGKINRMWADNVERNNQGNRFFGYYCNNFTERTHQRDVRIYQQDKIVRPGKLLEGQKSMHREMGLISTGNVAFNSLANGLVYLFAALKALGGAFGVGQVMQYVAAVTQFINGVNGLIKLVNSWKGNMPYLRQVMDLLDIPNKKYLGSLSVEQRDDNEYEIEFRNVSFKYPGSETYALRNLNLKFRVGERMAVVGENGSGKSTMISLLCRLYEPTEGVITLNGIDIKKYNYDQYMGLFGVVFQDFALFPFTLGENVAASIQYDRERVADCLAKAGFADTLARWKDGLGTYLYKNFTEEGVKVSGGEAQKIALARAIYKDAPFIVLDEPTAALDPVSEFEIYSKFNDIVEDKTAIYISHRLSSCRFCEDIAVFDHGCLVQRGNHESLLAEDGKYAQLWNAQAQYYQENEE